ncbi:neuronal PAS domain-containing protein 4-like [Sardina pilchardus]|uniref:neuronal PAS domain-containing protein 4-like n=1 Tax=Sardina pilchardus TaxID=27697 RepID=UPI002E121436
MSVICTYIRKSVLYKVRPEVRQVDRFLPCDFLQALPGFIVVLTKDGKLVCVSENVSDYLGLTMVDLLQGDTFYDMIDSSYVDLVRESLETDANSSREISFVCQMHTSKAFRLQHGSYCTLLVRGRFQSDPQSSLFVALCTPTVNRLGEADLLGCTSHFQTLHKPDMSLIHTPHSVFFHLGYTSDELAGQSWYSLIHPEDLSVAACAHKSLIEMMEDPQVEMVLRLQCKDLSWTWLYTCAAMYAGKDEIACTNYIISETEAIFLKQNIHNNALRLPNKSFSSSAASQAPLSPEGCDNRSPKRRRNSGQLVEESRKRTRLSENSMNVVICDSHPGNGDSLSAHLGHGTTVFSSPPYSPTSSHSPLMQEEPNPDYLLEEHCNVTEGLLSPPSGSPHYSPPASSSNSNSSRVDPEASGTFTPTLTLQSYHSEAFHSGSFNVVSSPTSLGPQPVYVFPDCVGDSCLVPDYQPLSEVYESPADCVLHPEDFGLLPVSPLDLGPSEHSQELPPVSHQATPLTPEALPAAPLQFHYGERELDQDQDQVEISLLARQISSLASSFNAYCSQGLAPGGSASPQHQDPPLGWPQHALPPYLTAGTGSEPVLDEGAIDCILKDLDGVLGRVEGWTQQPDVNRLTSRAPAAQSQDSSLAALVDCLPVEGFASTHTTADPLIVRSECQDQNTGLHQLNQYAYCSIPQDGLAEESMY